MKTLTDKQIVSTEDVIMKTLTNKQIISFDDIYEHAISKAQFKVVAFDIAESSFTFKVEMIENKNDVEHRDGVGATLKRVGDRLWISNCYDNIGGVAELISKGILNNALVAEALVKID